MNKATYNIHDDRLKVWFADRLSNEEYQAAKRAGFVYFYGQKCFSCTWRPSAEDFIARHGLQIECVAEGDDVAARVERYANYAEKAEQAADRAAERLESGAANTARRVRLAEGVAASEFSRAEHWQQRIAGAIRHAARQEDPAAIYRRIETLEKDLRRHVTAQKVEDLDPKSGSVWVGGGGRGQGSWVERSKVAAYVAYSARWADHLTRRIEYEQARLAATGDTLAKVASNEVLIEKGGAVEAEGFPLSVRGWYLVTKINPRTIEVFVPAGMARYNEGKYTWHNISRDQILNVASPAQVEAGGVAVGKPEHDKPTRRPKGTLKALDGKTPERFGAFGSTGGYCDKLTDPDLRWYLITKVNLRTVEYLTKQQIRRADGTTYNEYGLMKKDIPYLSLTKSADEVKAQHPELLADWQRVQEIKARHAAKEAAKAAQEVPA